MKSILLATVAVALTFVAETSNAQTDSKDKEYFEVKQTDGSSVVFKDDPMSALGRDAAGATISVRARPARALLIRPRLQFVSELLKSAEAL